MSANSITSNSSKEDTINAIRLELSADIEKKMTILVVEGLDDINFFKNKITYNTILKESYSGCKGVEDTVLMFDNVRVIGVLDRDYRSDADEVHCNIFYYDFSCLEMMIVHDDSAFKSFSNAFCPNHTHIDVRAEILKNLHWLSCFRKLSSRYSWHIKFRDLSISNCFISKDCGFDTEKATAELERTNMNKNTKISEKIEFLEIYLESHPILTVEDLFLTTNGHDFLNYFQCVHAQSSPNGTVSAPTIKFGLFSSYRNSDFVNTQLFKELRAFESSNCKTLLIDM